MIHARFRPEHLDLFEPNAAQFLTPVWRHPEIVAAMQTGYAYTLADDDGGVFGAMGCIPIGPRSAQAWALLAQDAGPFLLALTRRVNVFLAEQTAFNEFVAHVHPQFPQGLRWAKMFGFSPVGMCEVAPGVEVIEVRRWTPERCC